MNKWHKFYSVLGVFIFGIYYWQINTPKLSENQSQMISADIEKSWVKPTVTAPKAVTQKRLAKSNDEAYKVKLVALTEEQKPLPPVLTLNPPVYIPPIKRSMPSRQYQGDLTDHQAYVEFEISNERALKKAFQQAAKAKVAKLTLMLAEGKIAGLEQAELDFAQEKITALEKLQHSLQEEDEE